LHRNGSTEVFIELPKWWTSTVREVIADGNLPYDLANATIELVLKNTTNQSGVDDGFVSGGMKSLRQRNTLQLSDGSSLPRKVNEPM
jgi:hypothetical protein